MARPPLWETPEQLDEAIDAYFNSCKREGDELPTVPTVSGLCLAIGCCRDTLWEYAKKPEFSDAIKRARTRLEMAWETRLYGTAATGAIFWLKNQGWKDATEQTITATVTGIERRVVHPGN